MLADDMSGELELSTSSDDKTFKSEVANYSQFVPYAAIAGMKLAGYNGRSDWPRLATSAFLSNAVMVGLVKTSKLCIKERRPDNTTQDAFPSGHTATAFAAATILHKEYGLTRSPWFSVGGYGVATATGVMRVLSNRHWAGDVVAGAGIGILSTELGYFVGDMLWKDKGVVNSEMTSYRDHDHPSFVDVQMGVALHSGNVDFTCDESGVYAGRLELGTSLVCGLEGAYFINKNIGFGGMARLTSTPVSVNASRDVQNAEQLTVNNGNSVNNPLLDTSLDAGVYGDIPLCDCLDLGAKALIGCRLGGSISYKTGETEVIHVDAVGSVNYVLGLSMTWHYKGNSAWKVFADFDYSGNKYTYTGSYPSDEMQTHTGHAEKYLNLFTIGGSYTLNF